ncbi:MAG: hypothetical protein HY891_07815 [Deltaproteobacteria bacterium]|nr:hypothetical protein [Deltaproteobacteria bacterium]
MADQRIQYNEQLVGAGHPTKTDTVNRLALVEHNNDGTHKSTNIYTDLITKGPWIDVRAYGAVGNDSTDDTAAIQAAITAASGGTVLIPAGTYKIISSLTGGTNGIRILGVGREKTIIKNYGTGHAITTPAAIRGYTVQDLQILGVAGSLDCINLTANFGHVQLRNLLLKPVRHAVNASAGNGIDILMDSVRGEGGTIVFNFSSGGVAINSIHAINCYANASSNIGFDIYNVATFTATESSADNNTNYGWQISTNATLIGCTAEANGARGFTVTGAGDIAFIDARTYSQLLPFHINAAGANVTFINPRTASTPSGASIAVGTVGDVVLIGGANLDAGLSSSALAAIGLRFTGNQFTLNNHKIVYGTAAPATGTWAAGDMTINSAPTVGQPKGWRCTVAGTPGTWVSEGNL